MPDASYNTIDAAFERHTAAVAASRSIIPAIGRATELFLGAIAQGRKLLVCGNGGSAADAQHLAAEWVCRYKDDREPLPAVALTTDTSALTAIGNDYGFENIFSRQVRAIGISGDVLVAITTSGISKNILAALREARSRGLKTIVLTGEKGKSLEGGADVVIAVPSSETARIQEVHELIIHAWCECLDARFIKQ